MTPGRSKAEVLARVAGLPAIRKVEVAHELLQYGSNRRDAIALALLRLAVRELAAVAELRAALPTDLQELCEIDARAADNAGPNGDGSAQRTARASR